MRLVVRLIGSLVACVLLVSVASSYYQIRREERALRSELQKHSELLSDRLRHEVQLYAVPLHSDDGVIGGQLVAQDANYIASATRRSWREMAVRVGVQICLLALTTFIIFQRNVIKPIARTTAWMRDLRHGRTPGEEELPATDMWGPLAREATHFAMSLADARASAKLEARLRETGASSWTAERLAVSLETQAEGQPTLRRVKP